jgi:hypothetical protein
MSYALQRGTRGNGTLVVDNVHSRLSTTTQLDTHIISVVKDADISGNIAVSGNAHINGSTDISGSMKVDGSIEIGGSISVSGGITFSGNITKQVSISNSTVEPIDTTYIPNLSDITRMVVPVGLINLYITPSLTISYGNVSVINHNTSWMVCDGSTFDETVFTELYTVLGNSNTLPSIATGTGVYVIFTGVFIDVP